MRLESPPVFFVSEFLMIEVSFCSNDPTLYDELEPVVGTAKTPVKGWVVVNGHGEYLQVESDGWRTKIVFRRHKTDATIFARKSDAIAMFSQFDKSITVEYVEFLEE